MPNINPIPMECNAGDVLLLHNLTPHASFTNSTADTVRWSLDLRYSDHAAPNNVGESPESYTPERDPVTMYVCHCYHSKGIATADYEDCAQFVRAKRMCSHCCSTIVSQGLLST